MGEFNKIRFTATAAFVCVVLVFVCVLFKGPVKTLTQSDLTKQSISTTDSNNYKSLRYTIYDETVKIKVPDDTEIHVSQDKGDKMRFSLYFVNSSQLAFRGYIQLWKIKEKDLEPFLSDSKSLSPFDFKAYKISNAQQNNYHGRKTEWTANYGQNMISGIEYWFVINDSEEVVRVSFFTDTAEFPAKLQNVIKQILNSFEIGQNAV